MKLLLQTSALFQSSNPKPCVALVECIYGYLIKTHLNPLYPLFTIYIFHFIYNLNIYTLYDFILLSKKL